MNEKLAELKGVMKFIVLIMTIGCLIYGVGAVTTITDMDITIGGNSVLTNVTGESIDNLSDVTVGSLADNEILKYDSSLSKWGSEADNSGAVLIVAASDTPTILKNRADYVCDGTADQSEINTALAVSESVKLCPGTFTLSTSISLGTNHSLIGSGPKTVLVLANQPTTYNVPAIKNSASGDSNILIADLKVDGNRAAQSVHGHRNIEMNGASNVIIDKCWLANAMDYGIYIEGAASENIVIQNCIINGTRYGIKTIGDSTRILIDGCIISNTDFYGIHIYNAKHVNVANNIIHTSSQNTDNTYSHIHIAGSGETVTSDGIFIHGNTFRAGGTNEDASYAVYVSSVSAVGNQIAISNNDCWDSCDGATTFYNGKAIKFGAGNLKDDGTWDTAT